MNNKKVFVISLFLVAYFVKALVCHVMYVCIADEQKNKITHEPYATFLLIFFPKVKTNKKKNSSLRLGFMLFFALGLLMPEKKSQAI
jgi:hypothetical protein